VADQFPKIAVAVEPRLGREVILGCTDYAESAGWEEFSVIPFESFMRGRVPRQRFDGAVTMVWNEELRRAARALGCPVVSLTGREQSGPFHNVQTDDRAIGRLAARHLLERGLKRFCAGTSYEGIGERVEGFLAELSAHGLDRRGVLLFNHTQVVDEDSLDRLLAAMKKPFGCFCFCDDLALEVVRACNRAGIRVPNDAAVVGCDNIDLTVMQSSPPLSSIDLPMRLLGRIACEVLDRILRGDRNVPLCTLVPPVQVVPRGSTQIDVVDDPEITQLLQTMRTPEGLRQNITELADRLSMTRRTMERRFRKLVGRSPADELRRLKLERAKTLLAHSTIPVHQIAADLGFATAAHFTTFFSHATTQTPTQYRKAHRR
jgi:LacI family transcriptional regulator